MRRAYGATYVAQLCDKHLHTPLLLYMGQVYALLITLPFLDNICS